MAKEKKKMTPEQYDKLRFVTQRFVGSYLNVFKKGTYENKETNYNFTMMFTKDTNLKEMNEKLTLAKIYQWGKDKTKWPKNIASPIRDGDESDKESEHGYWIVKATSNEKPAIVDKNGDEILESGQVYAGAIYRAHLQAAVYELSKNNIGVKFYAQGLQKLAEGERLEKGGNSKKVFMDTPDEGDPGEDDESNYEADDDADSSSSMW